MDLANTIRPISETYFIMYIKQANDIEKAYLLEYCKVVMELREVFQTFFKAVLMTVRGNAFNVDYVGESEEDILTTKV